MTSSCSSRNNREFTSASRFWLERSTQPLLGLSILCGLYLTSTYSYLLFHTMIEMFSIIVSFAIFIICWNTRHLISNGYCLFIGTAFLFVGVVDLLHTLAYKNMGIFRGNDVNLPTQLWIAGRFLQGVSFLAAPFFLKRNPSLPAVILSFTAVTALLIASVFGSAFPDCFIEGRGLTPFKVASEYIYAGILLVSLVWIRKNRTAFDPEVLPLLTTAFLFLISSECAFTLYFDVFGISNKIGHFLKVVGYFFIYKALIEIGLTRPLNLLFTDLKRSEEALLKERNDLKAMNTKLQTANRQLEAFNYSVSHDLRGPLSNINGVAQVVSHIYRETLDHQGNQYLRHIQEQSLRMDRLITTMLEFSRLSQQELRRCEVDLSAVADEVAAELRTLHPERAVAFKNAPGVRCWADPELVRVVMANLLGNAWKYTAQTENPAVEFGATDGKYRFFIRDNGAGFDLAHAENLFRPFQRLHGQEFQGLGIGLATVQSIIQRHGGEIRAEGLPGKGATFWFFLKDPEEATDVALQATATRSW